MKSLRRVSGRKLTTTWTWSTSTAWRSTRTPVRREALSRGQWRGRREIEIDEIQRIDGGFAVVGEPAEVWSGHAPRRAHAADEFPASDGIPRGDEGTAEMQVTGDESGAVVDENGGAAEVQIADVCHHAAVRRQHRRTLLSREVDAEVPAPHHP